MRRTFQKTIWILTGVIFLLLGAGCGAGKEKITSVSQLNSPDKVIGVSIDTSDYRYVMEELPQAEIEYCKDDVTSYLKVSQGKLDAFVFNRVSMETALKNGLEGVRLLDENLGEPNISGVGLSPKTKIPDLEGKINAFLAEIEANGIKEEMTDRWLGGLDVAMPEIPTPEAPEYHLVVGTTGLNAPFTFYSGTELSGYDVELAYRFASWLNASIELRTYDYDGIIPAANAGDVDCIFANLFITPERAEAIRFTNPTFVSAVGVMVRDEQPPTAALKASFQKTFIREGRWKLFLSGIGTTLLITVLSILFGTALGFAAFLFARKGRPVPTAIVRLFAWLVHGMPVVVLLMITYYVIFGRVGISGTVASVIAFTLVFGAGVYKMLGVGVGAVDRGQTEAAYALGYSDRKAFFRVVLPQALPHIVSTYRASVTSLIKATAVVGYVAVKDLTRMGDLVRSRTYEAFFPLITVAIMYFVMAAILTFFVNRILNRFDPKRRARRV